ncbi:hypothetical protein XbC2_51 [Xanthomonas phage XbC2]|nr:hypothetical protein XbC2_51 [Xanthomonas phage XbC2]
MSNGNDKFNMFEDFEEPKVRKVLHDDSYDSNDVENEYGDTDEVEIVSVTMKTESRKKFAASVIARSQEEYETYIEGVYFETHKHPVTGEDYQVKVTVLKPEINPQELLRPAYAYSTNH